MTWLRVALVAAATAGMTLLLGWWVLPFVGLGTAALIDPEARPAVIATIGSGLGWLALLIFAGTRGPVMVLGERVAVAMNLPPTGLFVLVVAFPALVAGSAAWWFQEVRSKVNAARLRNPPPDERVGISEV